MEDDYYQELTFRRPSQAQRWERGNSLSPADKARLAELSRDIPELTRPSRFGFYGASND